MRIIDNKEDATFFKNVTLGEVFKMSDCSSYAYMKTTSCSSYAYMKITSVIDSDDGSEYNAVCLNDGDLLSIDDEERVFSYPYSEVIIKR